MQLRNETKKDYNEIYNLIKTAFKTAKVSDGDEQDFAIKLRNSKKYIPELALVVEEKGKLIGHIMLTKTQIKYKQKSYQALLLAPLSVLLEWRNKKVGTRLVTKALKKAKELGYTSVILVGDPVYYSRFGFIPSIEFGIKNENNIPDEYVQIYELQKGILKEIKGTINFET